jgi:hypothetical protein
MAAFTYGDCWRTVRLYCPAAPTFLAREWVNTAWKQLLAARRWGFMRAELTLAVLATDTDVTLPTDFASFKVVVDVSRQVRISFTHSLDELTCADPGNVAGGPVTALVALAPSTVVATLGQARYQLYPHGSASTLTAVYHRQGARLNDTSILTGVLADGGEVLIAGALAHAAEWPGTPDKPNPYFNATLGQTKRQEFTYGIQMLSLRDDEQYPDDLWDSWPMCDCGGLGSTHDLRTTDAVAW